MHGCLGWEELNGKRCKGSGNVFILRVWILGGYTTIKTHQTSRLKHVMMGKSHSNIFDLNREDKNT